MASFSDPFIRRPVATIMFNVAILVFGLLGLQRLPVRELPDVDAPVVKVLAIYPGAAAEVVETEVTERLEDAISGVAQIKRITSVSREQASSISIEFNQGHDIDIAAQDVRDAVSRVRGKLPDDVEEPVVAKEDSNARPVIIVSFASAAHDTEQLTRIVDTQVRERIQNVPGVSSVFIGGEKRRAIRLRPDPSRMAAAGVTIDDLARALAEQNVELPAGRLEGEKLELTLRTLGRVSSPEEVGRLTVRAKGEARVRVEDVAETSWGVEDERGVARFNGLPAVGLLVFRQSRANTLEVARGVRARMAEIAPSLPSGIETDFPYDESVFVERAVVEVWESLGLAFVLVVLTIFVFLRSPRATLIPALSIPFSVVGTFGCMYALGHSINIFTLLALVLAIGIVVDDAIVVLENIYRHIEEGRPPLEAAFMAMNEISFAVVTTTLSLVAVFLPLAFIGGVTGRLLTEFAVALSVSVIISSVVALTLAPMVGARVLRREPPEGHGAVFRFFERKLDAITSRYRRSLGWSLRHRPTLLVIALISLVLSWALFRSLDQEFLPEEDKGRMIALAITPEGSTPAFTDRMMRQMEDVMATTPGIRSYFAGVALPFDGPGSATQGFLFARFTEGDRPHIRDLVGGPAGIGARFGGEVEGAFAIPILPKAVDVGFGQPFALILEHPDLTRLSEVTQTVIGELSRAGFLATVRTDFELTKPEMRVRFDRERAQALGIPLSTISRTLQTLFGGLSLSSFTLEGKEYDIIAQLPAEHRMTPEALDSVHVRTASGELVPLGSLVHLEVGTGPKQIERYQRRRAATISGTPVGVPLGRAVEMAETILARTLPDDVDYDWGGEVRDLRESSSDIYLFFALAIVVVYMALAAQFESFVHPFTVMLALPLAFLGAFALLYGLAWTNWLGQMLYGWVHYAPPEAVPDWARVVQRLVPRISSMNLNIFSQVGLVLLVGLVTKNSILLVEFANQLRAAGRNAKEAMLEAGGKRLRPILMTSVSTIMGILPIAIGFGDAAESRRPLGVVAVGGMLSSTVLTLFVIPVIYTLLADLADRLHGRRATKKNLVKVVKE